MSLNYLVQDVEKTWLNLRFANLSITGDFNYGTPAQGDSLILYRAVNDKLYVGWGEIDNDNRLYNNQADLTIRSFTFTNEQPITFNGFKYAPPHYYSLSADKKSLLISSPGTYYIAYNFATYETYRYGSFGVYWNGILITLSLSSFIPTRITPSENIEQYNVCCGNCIFQTVPGINTIQIKYTPTANDTIDERGSIVSIIKLN